MILQVHRQTIDRKCYQDQSESIQRNPYVFEEDAAVADALLEQEGPRGSTTEVSTGVSNTAEQSSVQGRPDVSEEFDSKTESHFV